MVWCCVAALRRATLRSAALRGVVLRPAALHDVPLCGAALRGLVLGVTALRGLTFRGTAPRALHTPRATCGARCGTHNARRARIARSQRMMCVARYTACEAQPTARRGIELCSVTSHSNMLRHVM